MPVNGFYCDLSFDNLKLLLKIDLLHNLFLNETGYGKDMWIEIYLQF